MELIATPRVQLIPDIPDRSLVKTNIQALKILARDTQTSTEEVERIYETEFARLAAGARIPTFIPALALRRARAQLHNRRHGIVRR